MRQSEQYFRDLIYSCLSGRADSVEIRELMDWLNENDRHRQIFRTCVRETYLIRSGGRWEQIDVSRAKIKVFRRLRKRTVFRRLYPYAAVILLLFGVSLFFYQKHYFDTKREYSLSEVSALQLYPQQVVLSIGEDRQVLLDGSRRMEIAGEQGERIAIADSNRLDYRDFDGVTGDSIFRHTLSVPRGSEYCVTLSDGTRVWMNAMSELSYPEHFIGNQREVELSGEAYFEVSPCPEKPFVVYTQDMQLEVLGTSFNIRAYQEESFLTTTLITGKIRQRYVSTGQELTLAPHEQACFDRAKKSLQVGDADLNAVLAWKEGRILLRDGTLEEIFGELIRWYDFKVSYEKESLKKMRFYLNIDRYADIGGVLEKLERTRGIRFVIRGKEILVRDDVNK